MFHWETLCSSVLRNAATGEGAELGSVQSGGPGYKVVDSLWSSEHISKFLVQADYFLEAMKIIELTRQNSSHPIYLLQTFPQSHQNRLWGRHSGPWRHRAQPGKITRGSLGPCFIFLTKNIVYITFSSSYLQGAWENAVQQPICDMWQSFSHFVFSMFSVCKIQYSPLCGFTQNLKFFQSAFEKCSDASNSRAGSPCPDSARWAEDAFFPEDPAWRPFWLQQPSWQILLHKVNLNLFDSCPEVQGQSDKVRDMFMAKDI